MPFESKTVRDYQLARLDHQRASEILNKVKSLYFALWGGTGIATTQQVATCERLRELHICQGGAKKGDKSSLVAGFRRYLTTPKS